jgi:hypothetical protein
MLICCVRQRVKECIVAAELESGLGGERRHVVVDAAIYDRDTDEVGLLLVISDVHE